MGRLWKLLLETSKSKLDMYPLGRWIPVHIGIVETLTTRIISITTYREQYLLFDIFNKGEKQNTHTDIRKEPDLLHAVTEGLSFSR